MIGIDTNILVRHLTQDDELQSRIASDLIEKYSGLEGNIFVNNIVLCELVWVLTKGYKYPKQEIIEVLKAILTSIEFCFEDHKILWISILDFEKSSADFSDTLIGQINKSKNCISTYTFDNAASALSYFTKG